MKRLLLALLLLFAAEGAALACSCDATRDPQELRRFARDSARDAIALVEVDVVSAYDPLWKRGEKLRVRRTLAGRAPASIRVERLNPPDEGSCDLQLRRGQRTLLILHPPRARRLFWGGQHRISGLCTAKLLVQPVFRAALIEGIRRR